MSSTDSAAAGQDRAETPTVAKKLDELYALLDGIQVAMLVTRRADGHLVARAMKLQKRLHGVDLCFVTNATSHKLDDLANDPHVCLTFYRDATGEWVSVSGTAAVLTADQPAGLGAAITPTNFTETAQAYHDLVDQVWTNDLQAWFPHPNNDPDAIVDPHRDPRVAIVVVEAKSAHYSKVDSLLSPHVLYDLTSAALTNRAVPTTDVHTRALTPGAIHAARVLDSTSASLSELALRRAAAQAQAAAGIGIAGGIGVHEAASQTTHAVHAAGIGAGTTGKQAAHDTMERAGVHAEE
ncbi:hypothetical protein AMAG_07471 [Allomyces macrogynus ATCC 38327]|uniref:General stress protein FMN-binding split barrel domain-containing protein n=1 Tax=Allomyces macrogynus (strain ATCC 38327) TaxID=578462 RepID=A0A0L0SID4_ALLM3|nr:hypothetical protein AMAG_07471 [Allomyces macrogynus ATCC 38327]|eukprot:KNE62232.1 hypothetical protein AMAG_07471 [Allomyces macrogynus ATCC 38327]